MAVLAQETDQPEASHPRTVPTLAPPGLVLPDPPSLDEKDGFLRRDLAILVCASVLSMAMLLGSQVHFLELSPWLLIFVPYLAFTVVYFIISLIINLRSKERASEDTLDPNIRRWFLKSSPGTATARTLKAWIIVVSPRC